MCFSVWDLFEVTVCMVPCGPDLLDVGHVEPEVVADS